MNLGRYRNVASLVYIWFVKEKIQKVSCVRGYHAFGVLLFVPMGGKSGNTQ